MKIDMQSSTFQPPLSCAINQKRRILSSSMAKPLDASFGSAIFGSSTLSPPRQRQTNIGWSKGKATILVEYSNDVCSANSPIDLASAWPRC